MKIRHIIFDLDDTLCNYSKAKINALDKCFDIVLGEFDREQLRHVYTTIEPTLFSLFTSRVITKVEYRLNRFYFPLLLLKISNAKELAVKMNEIYVDKANTNIELFDDVLASLDYLHQNYQLSILTNGPSDGQRRKIKVLGIADYFQNIFISEEIGFAKPDQQAFIYVLNNVQYDVKQTIMVGDSLYNDIQPALEIGMKAYHINRHQIPTQTKYLCNLEELINEISD